MRKMMLIQAKSGIGIIFDASVAPVILKDDAYKGKNKNKHHFLKPAGLIRNDAYFVR